MADSILMVWRRGNPPPVWISALGGSDGADAGEGTDAGAGRRPKAKKAKAAPAGA